MRNVTSYSAGALFSFVLHGLVVAALFYSWEPDTKKVVIQPKYIEAKLVELAPKKKPEVKKPKVDQAKKRRELEKRRAAEKKKAEAKRLAAKKQREKTEREKREREQREKEKRLAEERKRIETELARARAEEQAEANAREDETVANSYMQLIRQRLSENWNRPPSARQDMETLIAIKLVPTGRIVGVTVLASSGHPAFDRSVEQAAFKADQFEELQQLEPRLFEKYFRTVKVTFSPQDLRL